MVSSKVRNAYRQNEAQAKIHPVKLIHLMYERTLTHLDLAQEALNKKDPRGRGENLGKVIALITELNASIRVEDDSEAAQFLRGLYAAILVELPKVSITNDAQILKRTSNYIQRLKEIWEQTAMQEMNAAAEKVVAAEPVDYRHAAPAMPAHGISVAI